MGGSSSSGHSAKLGNYIVLRDVYGDVFTYAGMGSVASHYRKPKPPRAAAASSTAALAAVVDAGESKPTQAATAGTHPPVTLKVKSHAGKAATAASARGVESASEAAPVQSGKVRLFAHPGNPDALASAASHKSKRSHSSRRRAGTARRRDRLEGHGARPRSHAAARQPTAICASRSGRAATAPRSIRVRSSRTGRSSAPPFIRREPTATPTCSAPPQAASS